MIDQSRIRRAFDKAAAHFDATDFLHREVRERLIDRLLAVAAEPSSVVDLGAGTGAATQALKKRFPNADVLSVDLSHAMLAAGTSTEWAVCADAAALPIPDGSVDLLFSNLMLHHCADPASALAEMRRVLADSGLLLFATFGRASLIELGRAWATADRHTHIAPFFDIIDLGNLLGTSGFAEPVLDIQTLTVTYDNLEPLMRDLRGAGSTNATEERNRGLTGRRTWQLLASAYDRLRGPDGKLPVTLEIVFGLTWAGKRTQSGGDIEIPIANIGGTREIPAP